MCRHQTCIDNHTQLFNWCTEHSHLFRLHLLSVWCSSAGLMLSCIGSSDGLMLSCIGSRVGVKYSTCTWYLYLSTYLSVPDVLEYLVYGYAKVLVLDQKVLGTYK